MKASSLLHTAHVIHNHIFNSHVLILLLYFYSAIYWSLTWSLIIEPALGTSGLRDFGPHSGPRALIVSKTCHVRCQVMTLGCVRSWSSGQNPQGVLAMVRGAQCGWVHVIPERVLPRAHWLHAGSFLWLIWVRVLRILQRFLECSDPATRSGTATSLFLLLDHFNQSQNDSESN